MIAARAPGVRTAEAPKVAQAVPAHTLSASRAADASRARAPFAAPFEDPRVSTLLPQRVQRETRVSSPGDPAEREAVATARKVMRMAAPPPSVSARGGTAPARSAPNASTLLRAPVVRPTAAPPSTIHRAPAPKPRAAAGPPRADDVLPEIRSEMGGGAPLPLSVRGYLEPRFRAEFGVVRVHTNEKAASLAARLSARAFTFGKHIFFGRGEFRPTDQEGMELIAHELTHTIQQKEVVQRQEAVTVSERTQPQVQRLGFDDILDWLADKANAIPGFRMFTIVLGVNPVNMSRVDRSAANILRAVVEFIPGGNLITRALDTYGVFDKVGKWIEGQIETLGMVGSAFKDAISDFIDSLGWRDLFRPGSVWRRAKRIFTDPIDKLIDFAKGFIGGILDFLREAALRPLAKLAEGTRAYDLLKAVLGKDPITGDPVEQSADVLIGGFMKLIGQEEVWENIKKGNAVARAFAWFKGVLGGVLAFVSAVPGMIVSTIKSITLTDFLPITNLFAKVGRAFAGFVGSFLSWGIDQVLGLLQIIFEVVIPRAVPYIKKAAAAFKTIIRDPIRFVGNLVRAGVQGFRQFSGRFLVHLRKSLVEWLTGSMRGANIYVPQGLSIPEIVKFALSVLGLTWENIRQKLVAAVGETAVSAMEATFGVVKTLVTQGPAAAWEQIKEGIGNLQQMVMGQIMTYVRNQIVVQTVQKLVTSLNPAGAFIQAVIAIYNTVMFFIERLRQIGQVVASFIDSISAIASGAVGAAANRVETTMAGLLTLVISFLARLAGLGKVSDEVVKVVKRIRDPIDKGLDRVVAWIVAQARKLGRYVAQAGVPQDPASRLRLAAQAATAVLNRFRGRPVGVAVLRPLLPVIVTRYGLTELVPFEREGRWWVRATINPKVENPSEAQPEGAAGAAAAGTRKPIRRIMTVNMGPVSHSLTTVVTAGSTQVTMDGGSLQAKLGALIEAVKDPKNNVRKKESVSNKLAAINTRLADYNVLLSAYARSLGEQHTARAPTEEFIRDYKATLVAEIVGLATNYGFTGLVVKTFIPSPLPNERHLPEPVKSEIRARLYERGSAWTTERATVVRTDTARIDKEIQDTIVKPRDAGNKAAAQAAMVGMKARGLVLEGATIDDFVAKASYVTPNLGLYAVDHDPSLAEHWQKGGGNATSDAVRHSVVEGKSYARLSLVTRRYNSQKGSYSLDGEASFFKKHAFILVPFTSAGGKDINGTPNSVDLVTIDSHSLTYPDGTPYLPI